MHISNYCKYSDFSRIAPEFKKKQQTTSRKKTRPFVMICEEK